MEHAFHLYNKFAADGIAMALDSLLKGHFYRSQDKSKGAGTGLTDFSAIPPVIVCIGTDLAIADSRARTLFCTELFQSRLRQKR